MIKDLEKELQRAKEKSSARRRAIKDLIRYTEILKGSFLKECTQNLRLSEQNWENNKRFWRFAKFCFLKLHPDYKHADTNARYARDVQEFISEWDNNESPPKDKIKSTGTE